jgi:hypothetical protein
VAGQRITGPDGRTWTVKRRWFHHRPRWRSRAKASDGLEALDAADTVGLLAEIPAVGFVILAIAAIVGLMLFAWFFFIPALIFLGELAFVAIAAAVGVVLRIVFRHPWTVTAETDDEPSETWDLQVVGFKESGAEIERLAYLIRATGAPLEP